MNFQFTEEQERFRQELRDFLDRELPSDWRWTMGSSRYEEEVITDEERAFYRSFQRKLGDKGWLSMCWPREYGGRERSRIEFAILRDEIGYYGAPGVWGPTYAMVVPMLLTHGNEEQKRKFLPPIARGEMVWCEGFSEPGAGSDLASLTTRAVREEDYFIIDGQKSWVSGAPLSDWCFFLCRTDPNVPKHKGLSMFLVDLNTPGVTRETVYDLTGLPAWQDIFLDGVKVPRENMVGEENKGWYVAITVLNDERSGIAWLGACRRALDRLTKCVRENETLANDPVVRQKLASLTTEVEVCRLACYYVAYMQDTKGVTPVHEASLAKALTCDATVHIAKAGLEILGPYGQLEPDSKWAPFAGSVERTSLSYPMWILAGGSAEIQRDVIARMGLGLPR